jgi:hypothetical protein
MRFQRDHSGDASSTKKPSTRAPTPRETHATKTPPKTDYETTVTVVTTKYRHTRSSSTTRSGGLLTAPAVSSPLPSAFDTSLGSNFTTASCETWFNGFLASEDFVSCHPFSLLLQVNNLVMWSWVIF